MKNLILLVFLLSAFLITGCSLYGSIDDESLIVRFPIKINIKENNKNYKIDSNYSSDNQLFVLTAPKLNWIYVNDLELVGNFRAELIYDGSEWCKKKNAKEYLFYRVTLYAEKDLIKDIHKQLWNQDLILVPSYQGNTIHIYDVDNKIRYTISEEYGVLIFDDLEEVYSKAIRKLFIH